MTVGKLIQGPWKKKGERSTEDVEFVNKIEDVIQNRLVQIYGSIDAVPVIELEALDQVMDILDVLFRTGE